MLYYFQINKIINLKVEEIGEKEMNKYTHIDCFSGPGGICTGLHAAGFQTLVAIEYIKSCCDTYSINHPEVHVINDDIRNVKYEDLCEYVPKEGIDLVTSGMPCETFSTAGNTSRSFYDDRQFLFREGIRIAQLVNAKMILFENVPGITTKTVAKGSKKLIIDVLTKELEDAGYKYHKSYILDSADYGVPQRRKRYFVLASKQDRKLEPPIPNGLPQVSVKEAFIDLPNVIPNSEKQRKAYLKGTNSYTELMKNDEFWKRKPHNEGITYHMPMRHREATLKRFSLLNQGESLKDLFERYQGKEREELQKRRILPKKMFIKRNYRLKENEPSPTVTSHCLDEFVHPKYDRALTVRECARLQSFPDSYDFVGGPFLVPHLDRTTQDKYEQIGDAVPPLLAYAWGKQIISIFKDEEKE